MHSFLPTSLEKAPMTINPTQVSTESGNKREQLGWYFYDWANSAFYTSVVTVFIGPYLTTITRAAADSNGFIYPLGIKVSAGSYFPYLVSLAVVLQVIFLPIAGAIADYSNLKKPMLAVCAYGGAVATMGMYFLEGSRYLLGGTLFLFANLCFGASIVFYNAFLPEISSAKERDHVSSMGWALGYLGGGLLLAVNLWLVSQAATLGLTTEHAVRISLASAGVWWAIFTFIPLATIQKRNASNQLSAGDHYVTIGFKQLRNTIREAQHHPQTLLFLGAYLLYNDGIQTVITLSSQFGQEELKLPIATLTTIILMVQFIAFFGSIIFNYIAKVTGAKNAVLLSLFIWIGTLVYIYAYLQTEFQFYLLAAVIALVLGGSQALSRSIYSQMIPKDHAAQYFSLYEISDKGTSWIGPLLFGLAYQFTGNYRIAILSLVILFVLGLILLSRVKFAGNNQ